MLVVLRSRGLGMQRRYSFRLWTAAALIIPLFFAVALGVMPLSSAAAALELPKPEPVEKYLGKAATGTNHTVKPIVRSDGVMRIFDVDTPYGKFTFDGVEFAKLRLHELDAVAALEKMSQSERFGQAFGRAALGPIKFGADLITNPADTVERSLSGIGNMTLGPHRYTLFSDGWLSAKLVLVVLMIIAGVFQAIQGSRRTRIIARLSNATEPEVPHHRLRSLDNQMVLFYVLQTVFILAIIILSITRPQA